MSEEKKKFIYSLSVSTGFIILLWLILLTGLLFHLNLYVFGVYPRKLSGLIGIFTAPLIHAGVKHLLSNSIPLFFLGTGMFYFYRKAAAKVFISVYLIPGVFVWLVGRPAYHIGASGMVYGFVTFIFFSGIIKRDTGSIALALIVTFLYGGLVIGIIPQNDGISWEYHLFGSLTGIVCAFIFRKSDPYKRYEWEDEEIDDDVKLEISYDREPPFN